MNKKYIGIVALVCMSIVYANEFTKKPSRKDNAQQEAAYNDCVQIIDTLIERICVMQEKLAVVTCRLYKKLRSCAVEEKPDLAQKGAQELREFYSKLQATEKQLQELEKAVFATEKSL